MFSQQLFLNNVTSFAWRLVTLVLVRKFINNVICLYNTTLPFAEDYTCLMLLSSRGKDQLIAWKKNNYKTWNNMIDGSN